MADRRHFGDPAEKGRHWWFLNIKESAAESKRAVFPRGCCPPFAESHRKTLGDTVLVSQSVVNLRVRSVLKGSGYKLKSVNYIKGENVKMRVWMGPVLPQRMRNLELTQINVQGPRDVQAKLHLCSKYTWIISNIFVNINLNLRSLMWTVVYTCKDYPKK